jgi:hypothetical protein
MRFHFILVDFLASLDPEGATIVLNEESESFVWSKPEDIKGLDVSENTQWIVEKYLIESGH